MPDQMRSYLDFEKPVAELDSKIDELRTLATGGTDIGEEVARDKFAAGWHQIAAEMAADRAEQQISGAVKHEQPGQRKMPGAGEPQAGTCRQRHPIRERAVDRHTIIVIGDAEPAGGNEILSRDRCHPDRLVGLDVLQRLDRQHRRHAAIAVISPIERRVIVEETEPAHQQRKED